MTSRTVDYDAIAESYDRRYLHEEYSDVTAHLLDFVTGEVESALEVGCGTGHWLSMLEDRLTLLAGVDPSEKMLERAKLKTRSALLVRGQAEALPLRSSSFDRIFCINSFHHFADKPAFVMEAGRVLRPSGELLTMGLDPHAGTDKWWIYEYFEEALAIDKERYTPTSEIRALMQAAGFQNCVTREIQHLPANVSAEEAEDMGGFEPSSTSQLAVLSESAYKRGLDRLRSDMRQARSRGEELRLKADLRLYATTGLLESVAEAPE